MIKSNVDAEIYLGGKKVSGKTNEWVYLNRQYLGMPITVKKEGCGERTVTPEVSVSPRIIFDLFLIGGFIAATALFAYDNDPEDPFLAAASALNATLVVVLVNKYNRWRMIDQEIIINLDCEGTK
jgi:hypothetical protein